MNAKEKRSYYTLMTIGVLGTIASIFNIMSGIEEDWYMSLITIISSLALVYGAQQLKSADNKEH